MKCYTIQKLLEDFLLTLENIRLQLSRENRLYFVEGVFLYIYVHAYNVNSQQCYNQLVRNYVDVNEHERLSNITHRHMLK